jgi:NADH pyrophosphatase NudC (nudix superfamily)
MLKSDSENWASTNDPKMDYGGYPPCPGCGSPLEKDEESGRYVCYDCDNAWETWELLP